MADEEELSDRLAATTGTACEFVPFVGVPFDGVPFVGVPNLPFVIVFTSIPDAAPPTASTDGVEACLGSGAFRVTVLLLPPRQVLWVF